MKTVYMLAGDRRTTLRAFGDQDRAFVHAVITGEDSAYVWSPCGTAAAAASAVSGLFPGEWGPHLCFVGEIDAIPSALFCAYNFSTPHSRADFLAWIVPKRRNSVYGLPWFLLFLEASGEAGIQRLFARIVDGNECARRNAHAFGFAPCGYLPEYFKGGDGEKYGAFMLSRTTTLIERERAYLQRKMLRKESDHVPAHA
jgi:hypothetical protein